MKKTVIEECKKGWRDGLWSFYFGLYLLPWCLIAALVDVSLYQTPAGEQPGFLALVVAGIGSFYSLYKARKKTGAIIDEQIRTVKTFISKWYNKILNRRKG